MGIYIDVRFNTLTEHGDTVVSQTCARQRIEAMYDSRALDLMTITECNRSRTPYIENNLVHLLTSGSTPEEKQIKQT